MYKPNVMIPFSHIQKTNKQYKCYMIDVAAKEIYAHYTGASSRQFLFGAFGAIVLWIAVYGVAQILSGLHPSDASLAFKTMFAIIRIVIGILIGLLALWWTNTTSYTPQREEYFKQHPQAKKVRDVNEIKWILDKAELGVGGGLIISAICLGFGVLLCIKLFNPSGFNSYFASLMVFAMFPLGVSFLRRSFYVKELAKSLLD